jgi:Holliday junction resolvase-like predicted endonuclease
MTTKYIENRYRFGLRGQNWLEDRFTEFGYSLYQKNLKRIGLELDLIMFKYIKEKNILMIHIIEVKTRRVLGEQLDLEQFNIRRKLYKVKQIMFDIPEDVKEFAHIHNCKHMITFDLAVVLDRGNTFKLHKYIQNVNLLL